MNDLKTGLMSVDGDGLVAICRRIVADNDYSDEALDVKFAEIRKRYPAYDAICRLIQHDCQALGEEALIHASGMEMMLRALITMAEEREGQVAGGKAVQPK